MFDNFLPIPDAESLPFYPLVLRLVVCRFYAKFMLLICKKYEKICKICMIETLYSKIRSKINAKYMKISVLCPLN